MHRAKRAVEDAMRADAEDAIDNMTLIDSIYKAAGLPRRQPTHYFLQQQSDQGPNQVPPRTKLGKHGSLKE